MAEDKIYDCIIIGAGPGGLQAAIYLGRYNLDVLLIDRTGGRTWHAKHIENFFSQRLITGKELITLGIEQAKRFNTTVIKGRVTDVGKNEYFEARTSEGTYRAPFVVVSSGVYDILPPIENLYMFFGISFFTCIDCDGYRTTGKKLVILGEDIEAADQAFAMKELFTNDITLIQESYELPPEYKKELQEEGVRLIRGKPVRLIGKDTLESIELHNGMRVECDVVMSAFGCRLNDDFLSGLNLEKSTKGFYITNSRFESSMSGLYIVGPLNTGNDQVVIAAGEGAVAAIDIKRAVLERRKTAFFVK